MGIEIIAGTGEQKIIQRNKKPAFFSLNNGIHDIVEFITAGPVIRIVSLWAETIKADAHAIQS